MRRRNMYYLTGQPGWMRFGYSPGWIGRSPSGLGPCAQFLLTGQWPTPQAQQFWESAQPGGFDRLAFLKNQAKILQEQLDAINDQIEQLEGK